MKACQLCLSTFEDSVKFCPFHGMGLKSIKPISVKEGGTICGYVVLCRLSQDGLGETYLAQKEGKRYRLRVFAPALTIDTGRKTRLLSALDAARELSGVAVPVVDYGTDGETHYYCVQNFIEGVSFQDIFDSEIKINERQAGELLHQLLRALRDIHSDGNVHGCLALSNIIIDNTGRVLVHDAGLWNILRDENFEDLCKDNASLFEKIEPLMSPEVARGEAPKTYSDIFSAGAAALMLLTHRSLANSSEVSKALARRAKGKLPPVRDYLHEAGVSSDFVELIEAALSADPTVRFQTTRAFITALGSVNDRINPSIDTLSPALTQKLIGKASSSNLASRYDEQGSGFSSGLHYQPVSDVSASSHTQSGIGFRAKEDTVVERTNYDGLTSIVGSDLPQKSLFEPLERAVTTQMDAVEATPTTEMLSVPTEQNPKVEKDPLLSLFDDIGGMGSDDFGSFLETSIFGESSKSSKDDRKLSEEDSKNNEEKSTKAAKQQSAESKVEPAVLEAEIAVAANELKQALLTTEPTVDASSSTPSSDVSVEENRTSKETPKPTTTETESMRENPVPHKRISKRQPGESEDEIQRGDVLVMANENPTNSKETRRVKRRKRREQRDIVPKGEVVEANLEVVGLCDPSQLPEFSEVPGMTASSGFVHEDDGESILSRLKIDESMLESGDDLKSIVAGDYDKPAKMVEVEKSREEANAALEESDPYEADNDEIDEFPSEKKRHFSKAIPLLVICVLVVAIICLVKYAGDKKASEATSADSMVEQDSSFDRLNTALKNHSVEGRAEATRILLSVAKDDVSKDQLNKLTEVYAKGFLGQAAELQSKTKKSADIPELLFGEKVAERVDELVTDCVNKEVNTQMMLQDTIDPELNSKAQAKCEATRAELTLQAESEARKHAPETLADLQEALRSWNELSSIYQDVKTNARKTSSELKNGEVVCKAEKEAIEARIQLLTDWMGPVEQNAAVAANSEQAVAAAPEQVAVVVPEQLNQSDSQIAQEQDAVGNGMAAQAEVAARAQAEAARAQAEAVRAQAEAEAARAQAEAAARAQAEAVARAQAEAEAARAQAEAVARAQAEAEAKAAADKQKSLDAIRAAATSPKPVDSAAQAKAEAEAKAAADKQKSLDAIRAAATSPKPADDAARAKAEAEAKAAAEKQKALDAVRAAATTPKPTETKPAATAKPVETAKPTASASNSADSAAKSDVSASKLIADAQKALSQKKYDEAIAMLKQATVQEPSNARAWFVMGRAYDAQNNTAKALECAKKACSIAKQAQYELFRGDMLVKYGDKTGAKEAYEKAKSLGGNAAQIDAKLNAL